jgi:hypothetical protein
LAQTLLNQKPTDPAALQAASQFAQASLTRQALNPHALRLLVFAKAQTWSHARQRDAITLVQRASRREPGAYIWRIEDAATRDDLPDALKNYDLALRTRHETATVLFPILANALSDADIRSALTPYVQQNPVWLVGFVGYTLENSKNPSDLALTIIAAGGLPKGEEFGVLGQRLLHKLVETGHLREAKAFAISLSPMDRALLSSAALTSAATALRSPELAWRSVGSASAGASLEQNAQGAPVMTVFSGPRERQIVASKLLFLDAAAYRLAVRFGDVERPKGSGMVWQLRCLGGASLLPLWASEMNAPAPLSPYNATVSVAATCPAQVLEIQMIGGEDQKDAQFEILSLAVSRVD